jgi:hypothetical protein
MDGDVAMATRSKLNVRQAARDGATVLLADGVLDSTTYLQLRDTIIKAALDEPLAVVVNTSALRVPAASAYAVLTSARWQVSRWPDVPVLVVCGHAPGRAALRRQGIDRWVPVHESLDSAVAGLGDLAHRMRRMRRRRRAELHTGAASARYARELVTEWLWDWGQGDKIPTAKVVTTELVMNVFAHTDSVPMLSVESRDDSITITVSDRSSTAPARIERDPDDIRMSGLQMVAALSDAWGWAPSIDGKTVWATITS